eukprot:7345674-Prymnesium_polylepis.1
MAPAGSARIAVEALARDKLSVRAREVPSTWSCKHVAALFKTASHGIGAVQPGSVRTRMCVPALIIQDV